MPQPAEILRGFVEDSRHLTTNLNVVASDMIRKKELIRKLDDDPSFFKTYDLSDDELDALRNRDLPKLFQLGLHPFLLVRFAGMAGILEYWQQLGAPGRGEAK